MEWKRFATLLAQTLIVLLVLFVVSAAVAGIMSAN